MILYSVLLGEKTLDSCSPRGNSRVVIIPDRYPPSTSHGRERRFTGPTDWRVYNRCVMRRGSVSAYTLLCVVAVYLIGSGAIVGGESTANAPGTLYLLAGTATNYHEGRFPVDLYRVGGNQALRFVREIVSQSNGLFSVHASKDAIFVNYPSVNPTSVSVIHIGTPANGDDVVFNSETSHINPIESAMAQPGGLLAVELFPIDSNDAEANAHHEASLVSVSSERGPVSRRIGRDHWTDYGSLRWDGGTDDPEPAMPLYASLAGKNVVVIVGRHVIPIDSIPPAIAKVGEQKRPVILAASQDYLVLSFKYTQAEMTRLGTSKQVFVHDRVRNLWGTLMLDGNLASSRLFGVWLATRVENYDVSHKPGPGRDHESNGTGPNVQEFYEQLTEQNYSFPGLLVVQNLADGRKVRIQTDQEDSEILWVGNDSVLYRVNDVIYQAKIAGDKAQDTTVIVKDENVPEIHWAFWSK